MSPESFTALFLGIIAVVSLIWTVAIIVIMVQVLKNLKQLEASVSDLQKKAMPALDNINANLSTLQVLLENSKGPVDGAQKVMGNLVSASENVRDVTVSVRTLATPVAMNVAGVAAAVVTVVKWYLARSKKGAPDV